MAVRNDTKKYNGMEKYLQRVSGAYVTVPKKKKTRNNAILKKVLQILIQKMKNSDERFSKLYQEPFFGGSYYDGLKVGTPDEYDIDLLLKFPSTHTVQIRAGEVPGFANLYLENKTGFENFYGADRFYLDTDKVMSWMEGVIQKAFNFFETIDDWYIFGKRERIHVKYSNNGPALTLHIKRKDEADDMDVDLVPCFLFSGDNWPRSFRTYDSTTLTEFFVVPKHPKRVKNASKYWRLSFQEQERDLIHDQGRLKPALKLIKKLRDVQQHQKMYSYFLKTLVLWEVAQNDRMFWINRSLSYIFMQLLKKCQECLENEKILYYWTTAESNLLERVEVDWNNMSNRLQRIINNIEENIPRNPHVVLKYLLTPEEQAEVYPKLVRSLGPEEGAESCTLS